MRHEKAPTARQHRTSDPSRRSGSALRVAGRGALPSLTLFLLAVLAPGAGANPFDTFGLGSRSSAMANAVTAVADDFSASLYNPAGLVDAGKTEISIGYFHASPDLETCWAGNWWDIGEDTISGVVLGVVFPRFEILGIQIAGGLGLHLPDKRVARSLILPYEQPRFLLYSGRNQRTVVYSPYAFRITSWLAVGTGFQMFMDTTGGPDFELVEEAQRNAGTFSEGSIASSQRPRFFPFAGVMLEPLEGLKLGFSFRDKQEMSLDIPMVVHIEELSLGLPVQPFLPASTIDLNTPAVIFFSPRQYAFGISWRPARRLLLAADVTYQQWSDHVNPAPSGRASYTGLLALLLRQPPIFTLPQGNLQDIWVPAVGVEWLCLDLAHAEIFLRAGYRYRPTPVPVQSARTGFLDSDTHIVTGGVGVTFKNLFDRIMTEPFSLDLSCQYFHLQEREYLRDLLVAGSDRFGDYRFRGQVLNLGVTTTFRF